MLSPKATYRVAPMSGIASTVTVKVQRSVRCCASVATHCDVVLPSGNVDPDDGAHVTVTGATPPVTVGAGKFTVVLWPVVFADWLDGQDSFGASVGGLDGPMGLSPHAEAVSAASSAPEATQDLKSSRKMRPSS